MRLLPGAAGVLLLLMLLTWLALRASDTNEAAYSATLRAFEDFALAEASLHRDVLQARAGLLRNYDGLGKSVTAMEEAVARLQSHARTEGLDTSLTDRLAATVMEQEELTERFKTSDALRQNSLSYVGSIEHGAAVRCSRSATSTRYRSIGSSGCNPGLPVPRPGPNSGLYRRPEFFLVRCQLQRGLNEINPCICQSAQVSFA